MTMIARTLAVALAAASLAGFADPAELIGDVSSASVKRMGPDTVSVCASGTVPTGGWRAPSLRLAPQATVHAGVYDLDFVAVRPTGLATQMVSPVTASFVWRGAPAGLKGVRVRGERAAAIAMLGESGGC